MKILRVRRQKKENKIYESRVFVSIFLTSLDTPRESGKLVNTNFNNSPDKSLHGHQVSTKIECMCYFTLKNLFYFTWKYTTNTQLQVHTRIHTHTCILVYIHIYMYIYLFIIHLE